MKVYLGTLSLILESAHLKLYNERYVIFISYKYVHTRT
jgi:hypothetical protein